MLQKLFSKIIKTLKKIKLIRKDLTYEEFINLEGKKFRKSEANSQPSKLSMDYERHLYL